MPTVSAARRRATTNTAQGILFDVRNVPVGEVIFKEGSLGLHMFLVEEGQIEISKLTKSGRKKVLGKVNRGGIFGEMALVDQSPRMATATAIESSVLRVIPNDLFQEKFERLDPFMKAIIRILTKNVRSLSEMATQSPDNGKKSDR